MVKRLVKRATHLLNVCPFLWGALKLLKLSKQSSHFYVQALTLQNSQTAGQASIRVTLTKIEAIELYLAHNSDGFVV